MTHYRRNITGSTEDGEFIAASNNPTLAVKLSVLIPGLLQAAAAKSTTLLTHVSRHSPSSSSDGHSRSSAKGDTTGSSSAKGTDRRGVPAVAMESISLADFEKDTRQIYLAISALNRTARLPAQQVLDHFASPTAAEKYVGWMEGLAGRILQYSQQPGSSSPRTSNASVMARVVAGRLPPWQAFAFGLLKLWALMPMLHFQCMLAAGLRTGTDNQQAANSTRSSSSRGAASSGSKQTRSTSSGGGGSATGSRSKQTANTAALQGSKPWSWAAIKAGEEDLESAVSLQVQAAWLRPNLLRLQHAWQHHVQAEHVAMAVNMQNAAQAWALVQRAPSLHPAVVQLGPSRPAVAAAVMQLGSGRLAELQEIAWSYLATGSALLRQQVLARLLRLPGVPAVLHPTLLRCPSYHKGHSYSAGLLSALAHGSSYLGLPGAYEGHLVEAEVWDLLPWQIELLQALAEKEQRALCNSSSSNDNNSSNMGSPAFTASSPTNSSATMAAATTGPGSNSPAPPWLGEAFWPLLPYAAPWPYDRASSSSIHASGTSTRPAAGASCQLPPVSADQLRLALERVCLNVHLCTRDAHTSLMLMVLLLLRADPALRLAFLQGPQGGLLMAALQLYGRGTWPLQLVVNAISPGLAPAGSDGWLGSEGAGLEGLQDLLAPTSSRCSLGAASTAAVALSWLLLQPSSTASWAPLQMNMVPGRVVCFGDPGKAAGGLPLINLPASALQLLPGYTPNLQLVATLETLLQQEGDPSPLLGALAASWQQDPSRAPPPDSPMWLTLASMAVAFRKRAAVAAQRADGAPVEDLDTDMHWLSYQLPLLRLAVVAQQQEGAGWGALVLGSAVQGTALACCAEAIMELRGVAAVMGDSSSRQAVQLGVTQAMVMQQSQLLQRLFLDIADGCRCMLGLQGQTCDVSDGAAVTLAQAAAGAASVTAADGPCTAQRQPSLGAPPTPTAHAAPVTDATAMTVAQTSPTRSGASQGGRVDGMYRDSLCLLLEVRDLLSTLHSSWPKGRAAVAASPSTVTPAPTAAMAAPARTAGPAWSPPAAAAAGNLASSAGQSSAQVANPTPGLQAGTGVRPSVSDPVATSAAAAIEDRDAAPLQATGAAGAPFHAPASGCTSSLGNSSSQELTETLAFIEDVITLSGCCEALGACAQLCSGSRLQLLGCANLGCTAPLEPVLPVGGCEASLVVNCRGSVCGGCGVVRYCSAACAQQDWPGHRRVCRRLAAAAAVRGANRRTGGVS